MPKCHPDLARYQYLNQWIIDVVVGLYDNKGQREKAHWHEKAILPNTRQGGFATACYILTFCK